MKFIILISILILLQSCSSNWEENVIAEFTEMEAIYAVT